MRIFLWGFMGSGKTTWGKRWAFCNKLSFIDLDEEIEKKYKKSITTIIAELGWDAFRNIEIECLRDTVTIDDIIIACGGGTPLEPLNEQWMNSNGITVYLKANSEELTNRLKHDRANRPLLASIPEAELEKEIKKLLDAREPYYNKASRTLNIQNINDQSICDIFQRK